VSGDAWDVVATVRTVLADTRRARALARPSAESVERVWLEAGYLVATAQRLVELDPGAADALALLAVSVELADLAAADLPGGAR
jgi:hypothetical protein